MKKLFFILLLLSGSFLFSQGNGKGKAKNNRNGQGNNAASPWTKNGNDLHYNDGNVGIGTTTPIEKLQVEGNTLINGDVDIQQNLEVKNNINLGANSSDLNTRINTYGSRLYFQGNHENNKPISLVKYNKDANNSELRMVFGDGSGQGGQFSIGTDDTTFGGFYPNFTIKDTGGNIKVGIGLGNSDPKDILDINSGNNGGLMLTGRGANSGDLVGKISFFRQGNTDDPSNGIVSTISSRASDNNSFALDFATGDAGGGENPLATNLTIDYNGNIGIGTTTPEEKLTVKDGSAFIENRISTNDEIFSKSAGHFGTNSKDRQLLRLGQNLGTGVIGRRNFDWYKGPEGNNGVYYAASDNNRKVRQESYFYPDKTAITLYTHEGNNFFKLGNNEGGQDLTYIHMPRPNSRVVIGQYGGYLLDQGHKLVVKDGSAMIEEAIYTNGRIAIGTTAEDPGYALTVKGKIHVQEVKVDLMGAIAPDYVFLKDYKLKTLDQVQDYISKEGHLPNIPSATQMEEEGINLKEMNLKLLEKVEELTLYTIAQEKAIKEQKVVNQTLEERLAKIEKLLKQ